MTQRERDRLVVLKKAQKKLITQEQAAGELRMTPRQVRRMLGRLRKEGDRAVIHKLRGRPSNRKTEEKTRARIVSILSGEIYRGFGPTLAGEYLEKRHGIVIGREALRQIMMTAGLWRARRRKVEKAHSWRTRRSCRGELVQWDTSVHDWLEGRGERMYLIHMIDDATSELTARFVGSDSTEENMRLLWLYLERHGRPLAFYTDKASLFRTAPKTPRDQKEMPRDEREPLPPTQIGRALAELGIVWIGAHSPQAKGRVERSFGTAQDRLVKGLRVARVKTLEAANRYLDEDFLPWWNQHLKVAPAHPADAHRLLSGEHDLAAILSEAQTRQVGSDYTIRLEGKIYLIARDQIRPGLRHANVRVEKRLDGAVAVRFGAQYLPVTICTPAVKTETRAKTPPPRGPRRSGRARPTEASRAALSRLFPKRRPSLQSAASRQRTRSRDRTD
jgi:hypothetical protein